MQCPQCSSECWDNSQKVANGWRGPIAKCKDASCGWVKWAPKGQRSGGNGGGRGAAPPRAVRPLGPLYHDCLRIAAASCKVHVPNATPADIVAAAACIFIAASKDGTPLTLPPKPKPEPLDQGDSDEPPDYA